jgi:2-C-methyl-D-erythritol 4-phosphate cytidylyltransferase
VRPLISKELISNAFNAAETNGNAIPVINVNDSLRKVDGDLNTPVNRDDFRVVQTPQCFALSIIKKSFEQSYTPEFMDEASVVESTGEAIHLIQGESINIKITTPADLLIAESFYKGSLR